MTPDGESVGIPSIERPAGAHGRIGRAVAAGAWLFAAYVLTAAGSLAYLHYGVASPILLESVAVPWLAVGVGVAGIMIGGSRLWPAIFLGSWLVWGPISGGAPFTVTVDAAAEAATIVLIARLLGSWGYRREFDRFRDPLLLVAAALIGRTLAVLADDAGALFGAWLRPDWVSAQFRVAVTAVDGHTPAIGTRLLDYSFKWILDGVAGVVLVVPAALSNRAELWQALRAKTAAAVAWFAAFGVLAAAAIFVPGVLFRMVMVITALLLVIWAAIDFGAFATAVAVLLMTAVAVIRVGLGYYREAGFGVVDIVSLLWGAVALFAMCGYLTVTLVAERRRDFARLATLAERYRRLFHANPAALIVTDAAGERIVDVNEAALRQYGYHAEELEARTFRQLAVHGPEPASVPDGADVIVNPPIRHRTAAGGLLDVELESFPLEVAGERFQLWHVLDVSAQAEMRRRLLDAADRERERLAGELHDGLGQVLTGLSLGAQSLLMRSRRAGAISPDSLEFVDLARGQASQQLETVSAGASPLEAAHGDLRAALRQLPETLPPEVRARLSVAIDEQAPLKLSLERSEHLLRVAQEALNNALKHARANRIELTLAVRADRVQLCVDDDGVGAAPPTPAGAGKSGLGMDSMATRASAAGAELTVGPRPGGGTRVACECPQVAPDPVVGAAPSDTDLAPPGDRGRWARWRASTPDTARTAAYCLLLAAACAAGSVLTVTLAAAIDPRLEMAGSQLVVPSLMAGAAAAGLVLGGAQLWPGVFLGVLVAYGAVERLPWSFGALASTASVCGSLLILAMLRMGRFTRTFDRWQDPLVLLGAAAVGWACAESLICMLLLAYAALNPGALGPGFTALLTAPSGESPVATTAFLSAALRWWADTTAGVVLSVPVMVAIPPLWHSASGHRRELLAWLAAAATWLVGLFGTAVVSPLAFVAVALVLVTWAAVRFGVALATGATLVGAMAMATGFALRVGALSHTGAVIGVIELWGMLVVLTLVGLFVTALMAERNRARREIVKVGERYRALFATAPYPVWLSEPDGGRLLMVNDRAVSTYGYEAQELLGLRVADLLMGPAMQLSAALDPDGGYATLRSRTKQGRVLEIELLSLPIDLDDGPARLWFARDVTETNRLRRLAIEATDAERARIASELRAGLGRILKELDTAIVALKTAPAGAAAALVEPVADAARRAAAFCRQISHRVAPARAEEWDLIDAVRAIGERLPESMRPRVEVGVAERSPLSLADARGRQLFELIREMTLQAAARGCDSRIRVQLEVSPAAVTVTVEARRGPGAAPASTARAPTLALRARSLGARLWERSDGSGIHQTCECPQRESEAAFA
jgi:PAS domain S-box-containing protein